MSELRLAEVMAQDEETRMSNDDVWSWPSDQRQREALLAYLAYRACRGGAEG